MRIGRGLIVLLVVVFSASSAMAGGFRLPEAGAKAMGMGFAFTAQADDPSAIYFNPAGIMQLEGINVMAGGTYLDADGGRFAGITPLSGGLTISESQKDLIFVIPNAYFTQRISPKLAWGVGIFSPFGLGQKYQDTPPSYFRNQIKKIDLITVVVNPTVAYKVNEYLSIGGGIDYMYGKAKLEKMGMADLGGGPFDLFQVNLDGDGSAWAFNVGALVTPSKEWKIGLSYRSPFKLKMHDANLKLSKIWAGFQGALNGVADNKADAVLNIPPTAALGISYTRDRLTLEVDVDWTFWSNFRSLFIDIKNNFPTYLPDMYIEENWRDTVAFYIGGEYRVTDPLSLRAGFRYDPTPVPSSTIGPMLPDALKYYYSLGAGYKYGKWKFDLAYMYASKRDRTVNNMTFPSLPAVGTGFDGKWSGFAHLVALDIGYRF